MKNCALEFIRVSRFSMFYLIQFPLKQNTLEVVAESELWVIFLSLAS